MFKDSRLRGYSDFLVRILVNIELIEKGTLIENSDAAKYISDLLLAVRSRLDQSVAAVRQRWPTEDALYRKAIGKILYEFYAEIMNLRHTACSRMTSVPRHNSDLA